MKSKKIEFTDEQKIKIDDFQNKSLELICRIGALADEYEIMVAVFTLAVLTRQVFKWIHEEGDPEIVLRMLWQIKNYEYDPEDDDELTLKMLMYNRRHKKVAEDIKK